jgi:hypothetical protein
VYLFVRYDTGTDPPVHLPERREASSRWTDNAIDGSSITVERRLYYIPAVHSKYRRMLFVYRSFAFYLSVSAAAIDIAHCGVSSMANFQPTDNGAHEPNYMI